jgi:glycosyltransferase involved in cell wall biosynthesis
VRIAVNARVLQKGRMEGVARYIYEVTRRMVANHPEHEFIFLFDRPFDPEFVFADNVTALEIGVPARLPILFKLWFEYSVHRALKKYKADVFFSGDAYLSLRSNIPSVMVSHDLAYIHYPDHLPGHHLRYYKKFFPLFHKRANHIIAVSEATKADIIEQFGISASKISIGHNASPKGFAPIGKPTKTGIRNQYSEGYPYFVYLGSLHPRKNIVKLIEAFSSYKATHNTEHHLVIVGRPAWNFHQIQKAYNFSPFKHEIHMYHDVKDEAKEMLASAIALIYISTFEGFGIPILEAFSSGVPVITSNTSSMPEVAGDAAIVIDPNDTNEIVEAMHSIVSDESRREQLISKGFERTNDFDWDRTAEIVYNCLMKVAKV